MNSVPSAYHDGQGVGIFLWLSAKSLTMRLSVLPPFPCM
uniref:Uncharacterized protein n=1 Tax=Arundo donax TaxID=35708 RepID=A0A0A9DBI3_ARUDO